MIYQFKKHYGDRFKFFTNIIVMKSPNPEYPLESLNILLINVGYVWALFSIVIITAIFDPFMIVLLPIVSAMNGAGHVISSSPTQSVQSRIVDFYFLLLGTLPLHRSNYVQSWNSSGIFRSFHFSCFLVHLHIMAHMKAKAEAVTNIRIKK